MVLKRVLRNVRTFLPSERLRRIEQTLDRLASGRATYVGGNRLLVRVIVAGRVLAYFVPADDRQLVPSFVVEGAYETELTDFFVRELKRDSHCFDVGSNFGYFTCLMGKLCPHGRVIGIEADEPMHAMTLDNITVNHIYGPATALHAAAGASEGEMTLFRRVTRSGNTSILDVGEGLTKALGEVPPQPFIVRSVPIDALRDEMGGRLDFMKVDVEGAEPLVISGAQQTIRENPQLTIVMEWSPGQISAAGFDLSAFLADMETLGLEPSDITPKRVVPLSFSELLNLPYRSGIMLRRWGSM